MGLRVTPNPGIVWLFFSPSGRVSRLPYFLSLLFWLALQGVALGQMFAGDRQHDNMALVLSTLLFVAIGGIFVVSLMMLTIKRVHDMGYSGVFTLLLFVPFVCFLALICFLFWPSTTPNDFGDEPNRPKSN